jgi:hypothetical protein
MRFIACWVLAAGFLLLVSGVRGAVISYQMRMPRAEANALADAIWQSEGGKLTRFPYGIKSVRVSSEAEARQVCLNTIQHWWINWSLAGRPGDFVKYLADTYCPRSDNAEGHDYWIENVHWFLKHPKRTS